VSAILQQTNDSNTTVQSWDAFISHAHEDKEAVAEPLAQALMKAGVSVWYDRFSLRPGQSLMRSIDLGLRQSKFGVVILSQAFFTKNWPQWELQALAQKQTLDQRVILPIWYDVSVDDVRNHYLLLADIVALKWSDGIQTVVDGLLEVITDGGVQTLANQNEQRDFRELALMSPRQAINHKWEQLSKAALNAGTRNNVTIDPNRGEATSQIINVLTERGSLSEPDKEKFYLLKKWDFSVAFGGFGEPTEPAHAITFGQSVDELILTIGTINRTE
jgi:hypothetical protein